MSDMRSLIEKLTAIAEDRPSVGDGVYLEFGNILQVDTEIMEMSGDSITLLGDEKILELLESLKQIEESAISSKTLSNYIEKASDARKHRKLPTHKVDNRYAGVHKADKILTARSKETVKEEDDDKHGSPYDRGRADSYYGRRHNPHKLVPNAHGGHEHEKLTDPSEVEAYSKGYRENTDSKDYGVNEADSTGRAVTPTSRFRTASSFMHDPDRAATVYKPNKYDEKTGLGGYISSHAQSDEKFNRNIINQLKRNLDTAIGKPLEFENGDTLEINPVIAKKALAKIENMKPQPRHEAIKSIMQSKANFVRFFKGQGVVESEIVSLQDNPQTLKRLAKMWWHGDEAKHAQAVKMLSNMGWDIDEDDDDIVLNKGDKEVRFFMDDLYESIVAEAEYHGRKVQLNKPHRGDVKKFAVFVKDPKTGNIKKVNFGDPNMRIKKSNPKRRKSFRARHKCHTAKDKTTARYWSCRAW